MQALILAAGVGNRLADAAGGQPKSYLPLAGETLNFQVRVLKVRKATDDELIAARVEASDTPTPEGEPS